MFLTFILLLIGFALLIKGADWLVDGASNIAKWLKISPLLIGLTVVAFGTSLPELVVNIFSAVSGSDAIAVGNVIGSNISNIGLIIGLAAILAPIAIKSSTLAKEIPFMILAAVVLFIVGLDVSLDGLVSNSVSRVDGFILLVFFAIFFFYVVETAFEQRRKEKSSIKKSEGAVEGVAFDTSPGKSAIFLGIGVLMLVIGGKLIVDNAIKIAEFLKVSQALIGLTIVSVGTSLPELATTVVAAIKKKGDIAFGNIVGSNIFNVFLVLGATAVISPLSIEPRLYLDMIIMLIFSSALFIFAFTRKKVSHIEGYILFFVYIAYILFVIYRQ